MRIFIINLQSHDVDCNAYRSFLVIFLEFSIGISPRKEILMHNACCCWHSIIFMLYAHVTDYLEKFQTPDKNLPFLFGSLRRKVTGKQDDDESGEENLFCYSTNWLTIQNPCRMMVIETKEIILRRRRCNRSIKDFLKIFFTPLKPFTNYSVVLLYFGWKQTSTR